MNEKQIQWGQPMGGRTFSLVVKDKAQALTIKAEAERVIAEFEQDTLRAIQAALARPGTLVYYTNNFQPAVRVYGRVLRVSDLSETWQQCANEPGTVVALWVHPDGSVYIGTMPIERVHIATKEDHANHER